MTSKSIYWYDYETFGSDPRRDRVSQFAGIRTDEQLNVIDDPQIFYCKPANDFLPSPQACLITGITPQLSSERGIHEAEFIARVHAEFARPHTCVAGYNSIRFDDELTRQLLYRNFYDPYEREWRDGNSRWDIIDMMRLCAALRPDGVNWPRAADGTPSFRLEKLTAANGISHADAHDARADVLATIEMARLVRQSQPRLYQWVYQLRSKKAVEQQIDLQQKKPVIHVSSMYPARHGCLTLVVPIMRHPVDKNGIVVCDLREDPSDWLSASASEIRRRLFTRKDELPAGLKPIPLKTLHVNRCPIVVPQATLTDGRASHLELDLDRCQRHWQAILAAKALPATLREALSSRDLEPETDPDFMIYSGGFFSEGDRKLMTVVRQSTPEQLAMLNLPFKDRRLPEMLFRYRARNFPETLSDDEHSRWEAFRSTRLSGSSLLAFNADMGEAIRQCSTDREEQILDALAGYAESIVPQSSAEAPA